MPGFYKLRQLLQELYSRIDEKGKPSNFAYQNLPPGFRIQVKQKLGLDDKELKGLIGALHYFGIIKGSKIVRLRDPDELYDRIMNHSEFNATIQNLRNFARRYYMRREEELIPNALSLSGSLLREIATRIVAKPRGLIVDRHTAITILEITRSFLPFIYVPGPKISARYPRRVSQIVLCLEELGGRTKLHEVYERCLKTGRLENAEEFVEALARGIILHDIFVLGRNTEAGKRSWISLARYLRAAGDYKELSIDRIRAFVKRVANLDEAISNLQKVGVKVPDKYREEFIERFVNELIDESVTANAEDFLAAYGGLMLEFSSIEEVIRQLVRALHEARHHGTSGKRQNYSLKADRESRRGVQRVLY